jgi:hypothetical protein
MAQTRGYANLRTHEICVENRGFAIFGPDLSTQFADLQTQFFGRLNLIHNFFFQNITIKCSNSNLLFNKKSAEF